MDIIFLFEQVSADELLNDSIVKYISCHIDGTVLPITLYEILHFQSQQLVISPVGMKQNIIIDFNLLQFSDS